jgi:integrase
LIAVLWRAGLRISEGLALNETDIDTARGSLLIRHGKGDKRREAGMDQFGFEQLAAWMAHRVSLPVGPLFCVIDGPTRGRRWSATAARYELRQLAAEAGIRRRFAPHQLRHAHAVELARDGVAVNIIQRQLNTPTSERRRPTCRASTPQRSSMPSDPDASQLFQRRRASRSDAPAARRRRAVVTARFPSE